MLKISNLCIIAGLGYLPEYAVKEALKRGNKFSVYILDSGDDVLSESLKKQGISFQKINLGNFDGVLKLLKKDKISHVLIVGKVEKSTLLKGLKFNLKTLQLLKKIKDWNDSSLFNLIASEFKNIHVDILNQEVFLESLLCNPGIYSKKQPSKKEWSDIEYGMNFAKKISELDIGQTVVVAGKTLLSVEAIEGTDEAIKRGAHYAGNKTAVVCKAMRKNQDTRFDVPTVGIQTLETMREGGCRILAIEAKHTFVIDFENFIRKVNEYKMIFVSIAT